MASFRIDDSTSSTSSSNVRISTFFFFFSFLKDDAPQMRKRWSRKRFLHFVTSHKTSLNAQQSSAKQSLCEGSVPRRAIPAVNTILSPRADRIRIGLNSPLNRGALRGARRRYVNTTWQPRRYRLALRVPLRLCSRSSLPSRSRFVATFNIWSRTWDAISGAIDENRFGELCRIKNDDSVSNFRRKIKFLIKEKKTMKTFLLTCRI